MNVFRRFLFELTTFLLLPTILIGVLATCLPATPRASTSLLFSKIDKDALLETTESPRLILVGGSNLSFGIDSQMLRDQLKMNPINTAIHGSLGLPFMLDWILDYVQSGDVIIVAAEYDQYFGEGAFGSEELLRLVLDVDRSSLAKLGLRQWMNSIVYAPKYALSKLKPSEYYFQPSPQIGTHERRSFNRFGDMDRHWTSDQVAFYPVGPLKGSFNNRVIQALMQFQDAARKRGAEVYLTYPCYQESSFERSRLQIAEVENRLNSGDFQILGTPERYRMPDQLMYDTPYHVRGEGVAIRTRRLIEDYRSKTSP